MINVVFTVLRRSTPNTILFKLGCRATAYPQHPSNRLNQSFCILGQALHLSPAYVVFVYCTSMVVWKLKRRKTLRVLFFSCKRLMVRRSISLLPSLYPLSSTKYAKFTLVLQRLVHLCLFKENGHFSVNEAKLSIELLLVV